MVYYLSYKDHNMWTQKFHAAGHTVNVGSLRNTERVSPVVMAGLLVVMVCASLLDAIATQRLVTHGLVVEGNPMMAPLIPAGHFVLVRILGILICGVVLWLLYKRFPRVALTALMGVIFIYTAILVWNTGVLLTV
jgi:hypothetical protein